MFLSHPRLCWQSALFLSLFSIGCTFSPRAANADPSLLSNLEQTKYQAGLTRDNGYEPTPYQRDPVLIVDLVRDSAVQEPALTSTPSRLQQLVERARQLRD